MNNLTLVNYLTHQQSFHSAFNVICIDLPHTSAYSKRITFIPKSDNFVNPPQSDTCRTFSRSHLHSVISVTRILVIDLLLGIYLAVIPLHHSVNLDIILT